MNTMLKNSVDLSSFYIQNPETIYDFDRDKGENNIEIELLLPFDEYINSCRVSLGVPIEIGTFYNDPTLVGVTEEKYIKLNEMGIRLTELKEWSSISYRGIEFKIPLKDFEKLLSHKAILKIAEDARWKEYVDVIYDYNFGYNFRVDFALNYD